MSAAIHSELPDDVSVRSLLGSLKNLPPQISVRVCEQTADLLHQADFLRRALHVQTELSGQDALAATEKKDDPDAESVDIPTEAASQLDTLFSAASSFTPQVLDVVARAVSCKRESVRTWFEQRNRSTRQTCKRLSKKRTGAGSGRGALFRRSQAVVDAPSAGAIRLAPKTAVESSLSLMQLFEQSDSSRPKIRDDLSAKAFACVTQCPSILLQTMLLRCVQHTKQIQLMPLSKSEVYTTLAQWLQDAVQAENGDLIKLCLVAFNRIPWTEVHVLTMTTHRMHDGAAPSKPARRKRADHSNPTIAEYIQRLQAPEYRASVRRIASHLLERWGREKDRTDTAVVPAGGAAPHGMKNKKGSLKRHDPSAAPVNVFPKDRRMKATEAVALPMNSTDAQQFKVSNAQKSSAAQRRKAADAGPLSVADIKKRKQKEQLRKEMANKKQRSTSGAGSKPAANATATPPSASGTPGGPTPPSPSGAGARLAEHAGSVGASRSPAAPQRGDVRPDENAHAQTATARPQHQANGAGSSAPNRRSSVAGDRQGGNGLDNSKHGTSQEPRSTPYVAAGASAEPGPAGAQAAYVTAEDKKGMEQLEALVAKGKSKKRSRMQQNCWMAEDLLVEDAEAMLKKARANPGNCHPEVLRELNAIVKRGERIKSVRARFKDPTRESLEALVAKTKWRHPRTHTLSQELIKVRSSWAADSVENNKQRERAYTTSAAPASTTLTPVFEKEGIGSGGDADPEPEECPFWPDIPEGTKPQSAWWQFKGRVHLYPLAHAWQLGIRCMPAPHGIPLVGLSDPQLKAARKVVQETMEEEQARQAQLAPQETLPPVQALPSPPPVQNSHGAMAPGIYSHGHGQPAFHQMQPAAGMQYMQQPYPAAGQGQPQYVMPGAQYMHAPQSMIQQPGMVVNHQKGPMAHVHAHVHAQPMPPAYQQQHQQPVYPQQQQPAYQQQPVNGYQQQQPSVYGQPAPQVPYYQPNNNWQQ